MNIVVTLGQVKKDLREQFAVAGNEAEKEALRNQMIGVNLVLEKFLSLEEEKTSTKKVEKVRNVPSPQTSPELVKENFVSTSPTEPINTVEQGKGTSVEMVTEVPVASTTPMG